MIVCIGDSYVNIEYTRCIPTGPLGEHATVALMTGCEASLTMYRIGFEWRQENPSGNLVRYKGLGSGNRVRLIEES